MEKRTSPKWMHNKNIPIYYTVSHGPDRQALNVAFQQLMSLAANRTRECAVAVGTMQVIGRCSEFEKLVGQAVAEALRRGSLQVNGIRVKLITRRLRRDDFGSGPILALYLQPRDLEKYFEEGRITDLIYVPWLEADMKCFPSECPAASVLKVR